MFTGIVQAIGRVRALERRGDAARLVVATEAARRLAARVGDSIAVDGVCLTAVELEARGFSADLSAETLACTTLGGLEAGARVNLEGALAVGGRLGGHFVTGHVDGVGTVRACDAQGASVRMRIEAPRRLARYIAVKGAICVDGVSLTVHAVAAAVFEVQLIPHTLGATTLGDRRPGHGVNLEVDIVARYLERLLADTRAGTDNERLARLLAEHGFLDAGGVRLED